MKQISKIKTLIIRTSVLALALVLVFDSGAVARALSADDLNSIYNDTVWYLPSGSENIGCSSTTAPGSGSPSGAQFPNLNPDSMADAINKWISQENSNSKLGGLGTTIVAGAKNSNVNPFLIVAIAHEESGLADPSDWNVANASNSFGREATASQPNVPSPTRPGVLWYKWSSVEASVDNTAPENQKAAGGGDIAAYIRNQYGGQLDSNNLTAMFLLYAPPGENNTEQYIANVQSWIDDLIKLTGQSVGQTSISDTSCVSTDCAGGVGSNDAAILCEAQKYAGIYYKWGGGHEPYATFRKNCPEAAISSAAAASTVADPGPCATDCSGLVNVAVDAAFNQNYGWSIAGQMVGAGSQYWQSIPISQAKAGDIVTTSEHVEIVDHVQNNTVYTFGSHYTGTKTGPIPTSISYWSGAYHWTGPGSNG